MNKSLVAGTIAVVAVFAGVAWFIRDTAEEPRAVTPPAKPEAAPVAQAAPAVRAPPMTRGTAASRPAVTDPRLAALIVSADNGLVEFLADPDGRVIREIDNDPASPGYRKPLRDYTYAGDKVIRLVKYLYTGNEVQTVTADVRYKADGSIDQYRESTEYVYRKAN